MSIPQYPGNAMPAPGLFSGTTSVDDELLFSANGYQQKGVTLKPGQGVLLLGTFLKRDAASKKYVKATAPAEVEGVLRQTTDTGTSTAVTAPVYLANILYGGVLKLSKVTAANSGVALASVLKATVNETAGFFKF